MSFKGVAHRRRPVALQDVPADDPALDRLRFNADDGTVERLGFFGFRDVRDYLRSTPWERVRRVIPRIRVEAAHLGPFARVQWAVDVLAEQQ